MVQIQVTLFDKQGRYRPVSTLVNVDNVEYFNQHREKIKTKAVTKICVQRSWTKRELKEYGYTTCKVRVYDKEKIEAEKKVRYEKIKEERGWK